ncbi:hypothetical protein ACIP4U_33715 [Streptomyces caelestis]|uniref:hypothetical protein n=1 Tax=Streptomyces caelestis TaxID=36816 RepID=UPI00381C3C6C
MTGPRRLVAVVLASLALTRAPTLATHARWATTSASPSRATAHWAHPPTPPMDNAATAKWYVIDFVKGS